MIKKCLKKDIDLNRPMSEQKWCLYSKDGSKLLGRHPSKESALKQERAVQIHKHASIGIGGTMSLLWVYVAKTLYKLKRKNFIDGLEKDIPNSKLQKWALPITVAANEKDAFLSLPFGIYHNAGLTKKINTEVSFIAAMHKWKLQVKKDYLVFINILGKWRPIQLATSKDVINVFKELIHEGNIKEYEKPALLSLLRIKKWAIPSQVYSTIRLYAQKRFPELAGSKLVTASKARIGKPFKKSYVVTSSGIIYKIGDKEPEDFIKTSFAERNGKWATFFEVGAEGSNAPYIRSPKKLFRMFGKEIISLAKLDVSENGYGKLKSWKFNMIDAGTILYIRDANLGWLSVKLGLIDGNYNFVESATVLSSKKVPSVLRHSAALHRLVLSTAPKWLIE